jgi:hypothetical protein
VRARIRVQVAVIIVESLIIFSAVAWYIYKRGAESSRIDEIDNGSDAREQNRYDRYGRYDRNDRYANEFGALSSCHAPQAMSMSAPSAVATFK